MARRSVTNVEAGRERSRARAQRLLARRRRRRTRSCGGSACGRPRSRTWTTAAFVNSVRAVIEPVLAAQRAARARAAANRRPAGTTIRSPARRCACGIASDEGAGDRNDVRWIRRISRTSYSTATQELLENGPAETARPPTSICRHCSNEHRRKRRSSSSRRSIASWRSATFPDARDQCACRRRRSRRRSRGTVERLGRRHRLPADASADLRPSTRASCRSSTRPSGRCWII